MTLETRPGGPSREDGVPPPVSESIKRLADGLSNLVRDHLVLIRGELREDLRSAGRDLILAAVGLPGLLLGYALLMVALSILVGRWLTPAGGFALVGVLNLMTGALLAYVFARRLATVDMPSLDRTAEQFKENGRWLRQMRNG